MSEMIERVARAIHAAEQPGGSYEGFAAHAPDPQKYIRQARAAIEAMRDPTDEQRSAFYELSHETETMFDAHWERAIDAALRD